MDSTLIEFWAMVWEKKSHAVVMLSLLKENEVVSICYYNNVMHKLFLLINFVTYRMFLQSIGLIRERRWKLDS